MNSLKLSNYLSGVHKGPEVEINSLGDILDNQPEHQILFGLIINSFQN